MRKKNKIDGKLEEKFKRVSPYKPYKIIDRVETWKESYNMVPFEGDKP